MLYLSRVILDGSVSIVYNQNRRVLFGPQELLGSLATSHQFGTVLALQ